MLRIFKNPFNVLLALSCLIMTTTTPVLFAAAQFPIPLENWRIERLGADIWDAASKESDQIKAKVVVIKRRRHGNFMDADFRFEFSEVPMGNEYRVCIWDFGMRRDGLKPTCWPGTSVPDSSGKIVVRFELKDYSQGEWMQLSIRSTDGKIQKSAKFTPFK